MLEHVTSLFKATFAFALLLAIVSIPRLAAAQLSDIDAPVADEPESEVATPEQVQVEPVAEDDDITARLERIFSATGWFDSITVSTDEGVVFLEGVADTAPHREFAERVALRTSDVVAVVNKMTVRPPDFWDVDPAIEQLRALQQTFLGMIPLIFVGIVIAFLSYWVAKLVAWMTRKIAQRRIESQLLQQVIVSIVAVLVMLIGVYIALKVSGLSRLAVTVLGGTGLVGLALGFAFRDIAENYLASILISLNRPFHVGDLIELEGHKGFVRRVTTRGTLLLTVEGNHVQIPNNTVYKSAITNYSSSPRIRTEFSLGIGYTDSATEAQAIVLQTVEQHASVLKEPPPLVLVDSLGAATVNLKILFWLDGQRFDAASVRSALMRRAKTALAEANISMPDEAREVVFPEGVPVAMLDRQGVRDDGAATSMPVETASPIQDTVARSDKAATSEAEGDLHNTSEEIQRHAEEAERDEAANLID